MKPVTNFKLGVFALVGVAGTVAIALVLGLHARRAPSREMHVLFDESVQGLDLGAPVKYRGVEIGSVARIDVAGDRRSIDVALAIDLGASQRLGLASPPTGLRAHLASQGITGVKLIDLDFADPDDPPGYGPADPHYLLSEPSLAKRLEDEGLRLGRSLPRLVDDARTTLHRVDAVLDDSRDLIASGTQLGSRATTTLGRIDALARETSTAVRAVRDFTAHLDADDGLATHATRATDAIHELAQRTTESTVDLDQTLRDLGEASRMIRSFVEDLEREPDILVKGHGAARKR